MKALIAAGAIVLAAALGYADPGVWSGAHQPINHIDQMLHHESEQPTGTISVNSIANAAVAKSGFTQTTDFIANGDLKTTLGAK